MRDDAVAAIRETAQKGHRLFGVARLPENDVVDRDDRVGRNDGPGRVAKRRSRLHGESLFELFHRDAAAVVVGLFAGELLFVARKGGADLGIFREHVHGESEVFKDFAASRALARENDVSLHDGQAR